MTALLVAFQLACGGWVIDDLTSSLTIGSAATGTGSIQIDRRWSDGNSDAKLMSLREGNVEVLYFDQRGQLHLVRWCTPWDITFVLLSAMRALHPPAPTVDI